MTNSSPTTLSGNGGISINIVESLDDISRYAAEQIVRQLAAPVLSSGLTTIALSGGSTPVDLYRQLGSRASISGNISWDKLHLFWGDERHVPPDHAESNYRMARETLLDHAPVPSRNVHRIPAENPDAAAVADNYEQELVMFFQFQAGDLPQFDCVLLGIGTDGHTASLFPGTEALHEARRSVVANWVEKFQAHRITMTAPVLNNAALIIILVSGPEKAGVLREVLEGEYRPERLPVQLIRPVHGRLLWLVDRAAAGQLTGSHKIES